MRTAGRSSRVEAPSVLRQLLKETEKVMVLFFKGAPGLRDGDGDPEDEDASAEADLSPYLNTPVLQMDTAEGQSEWGVSYALACMQGWRVRMEDAHACAPDVAGAPPGWSFFAVFDGHGGGTVAQYCSKHLLHHILASGGISAVENVEQVKSGIRDGFLDIDRCMQHPGRSEEWDRSGSTVAAVIISPQNIYFINCGDSRACLSRRGRVTFCTEDHKPCNPGEKDRIQSAGGSVTRRRVNGSLAVSRALGDFAFKEVQWRTQTEQLVSPEPEVRELERVSSDEFLVVACDGVWDAVGSEELCTFVRDRLHVCDDLRDVCAQVLDLCLQKGSLDNMTVIIICFSGAPHVTPEALQQEAKLEQLLDHKVEEVIQVSRSNKGREPELLDVMKLLATEDIPGLPPGGGITSKRHCIAAAYQKYATAFRTLEPVVCMKETTVFTRSYVDYDRLPCYRVQETLMRMDNKGLPVETRIRTQLTMLITQQLSAELKKPGETDRKGSEVPGQRNYQGNRTTGEQAENSFDGKQSPKDSREGFTNYSRYN
ncbi:protein phosphatase, Mg2+/Mn2+ dependent, 1Na (putative) [Brachyhypopomus gauderio]|uniref:protein phosphatase, Mg2+/Mn2+ dependent, 1Na (putative) n=1 Tax=Brachyhypopomus gauderio TaxID=698409 RepID=UPI0040418C36